MYQESLTCVDLNGILELQGERSALPTTIDDVIKKTSSNLKYVRSFK